MSERPHVTIAGGGLAGLTAALRLAERDYPVTLYEQKSILGGDLASRPAGDGVELDVYPHMYLSWYGNFWRLMGDVGVDPASGFRAFSDVKQLRRGRFPRFDVMTDLYSLRHAFENLNSGVAPLADMLVLGYASVDLLAEGLNPTMLLDEVAVTGFLNARPYMTERAAEACDSFITMVWAIPSYLAAAEDYRLYLAYSFANHDPAYWLAEGSALQQVIAPLTRALRAKGVDIHLSEQVTRVTRTGRRVTGISVQETRHDEQASTWVGTGNPRRLGVDELILAVPPDALSALVRTGGPGHRVVEALPALAEVSRLRTERIPIVHLAFTTKLAGVPPEPIGLFKSRLALAFTDVSQTWTRGPGDAQRTVLSVSASDPYALPGTAPEDDGFAIIRELARYLDFEPGAAWGQSPAIDWARTRYEPNTDTKLFVNETGTDVWRPRAGYEDVENVSFAGDFCDSHIGMTTIESAVTTGLAAAQAVVERHGGDPVAIATPQQYPRALYVWLRYAWAPYAYAAKAWSMGSDVVVKLRDQLTPTR